MTPRSVKRLAFICAAILIAGGGRAAYVWNQGRGARKAGFFITEPGTYSFGPGGCYIRIWQEANGRYDMESRLRYRDGRSFWSQLSGKAQPNESPATMTALGGFISPDKLWFCYVESGSRVWLYHDNLVEKWFEIVNGGGRDTVDRLNPQAKAEIPPPVNEYLARHSELSASEKPAAATH